MKLWHVDASAEHVNYQTVHRLETSALCEAEREWGKRRNVERAKESKREIRETPKHRQRGRDRGLRLAKCLRDAQRIPKRKHFESRG